MSKETNQSRRRFLAGPVQALPAVVLTSSGLGATATALAQADNTNTQTTAQKYMPVFFHEDEWQFIQSAVDLLIPEDEHGPGAIAAYVPEFIDRQMETPYAYGKLWYMEGPFDPDLMKTVPELGWQSSMTPRDVYRSGIAELNRYCHTQYSKNFSALDKETQTGVLKDLETQKIVFPEDAVYSQTFFNQLLNNTREGFFADPMYGGNKNMVGWKMVGFPGARADFTDWIGQHNARYPYGPVSIKGETA